MESTLFGTKTLPGAQAQFVRVSCADGSLVKAFEGGDIKKLVLMADVLPTGVSALLYFDLWVRIGRKLTDAPGIVLCSFVSILPFTYERASCVFKDISKAYSCPSGLRSSWTLCLDLSIVFAATRSIVRHRSCSRTP